MVYPFMQHSTDFETLIMNDMLLNRQRCDKIWSQINLLLDNIDRHNTEPHFQHLENMNELKRI